VTYLFTFELNTTSIHGNGHTLLIGEGSKCETLTSVGFSIIHDGSIMNFTKLGEENLEGLRSDTSGKTTDKDFCRLFMFSPGDSSFRVNLLFSLARACAI
jgi:hypothetical protein